VLPPSILHRATPSIKYNEIREATGVGQRTLRNVLAKVLEQGYDPLRDKAAIKTEWLVDRPRSGRPRTAMNEINEKRVIKIISKDKNGREKSAEVIGMKIDVSRQLVCGIMKKLGYKKVKSTTKPGLNQKQKEKRLAFCRKYQYWTLEDWKRVIWSDETSIVLG
jgi:hypothetical protein